MYRSLPRLNVPEEIDVGNRVRQIVKCGPLRFLVRTAETLIVFEILFVEPKLKRGADECWGTADLRIIQTIDCRSMLRYQPSYRPVHVASHPRYGSLAPSKIAAVYASTSGDQNSVHHIQCDDMALTKQQYTVSNLQTISSVEFESETVLWAAARSFVRPDLAESYTKKRYRVGHGFSLYSIDLREPSKGVFQWSPSADDFLPECYHSISGIWKDWDKDHRVTVASVSAGKTWELDTRMPCRVVNTWSLPHSCDQPRAAVSVSSLLSARTIFDKPLSIGAHVPFIKAPMLSVGTRPGTYGIHLYNKPLKGPRFRTQSPECVVSTGLDSLGENGMATGLSVPLADTSSDVFTCGLTSFQVETGSFLRGTVSSESGNGLGDAAAHDTSICAVSLTSKGDIYMSVLSRLNILGDHLPIGNTRESLSSWNVLPVSLCGESPVPSRALKPVARSTNQATKPLDLLLNSVVNPVALDEFESRFEKTTPKMQTAIRNKKSSDSRPYTDGVKRLPVPEILLQKTEFGGLSQPAISIADGDGVVGVPRQHANRRSRPELFLPKKMSAVEEEASYPSLVRSDLTAAVLGKAWSDSSTSLDDDV